MSSLNVNISGVDFKNPVITASGTFGFGEEYSNFYPLSTLGGISLNAITLEPRAGNPPIRIAETPSGILNSVGLQNPGVQSLVNDTLPWLEQQGTVIIANVAGSKIHDYCKTVEILSDSAVDMIELNISCPNVKQGGLAFGTDPKVTFQIVSQVRKVCKKPLIVKLSPNVTDICAIAQAAEQAGSDALSLINTLTGMAVDIDKRRPVLSNIMGGLSGAAVKPIALRMVWQVYNSVDIPIIGMGGINTWQDAIEFIICGASAVMVGTANFSNPMACPEIIKGIEQYLSKYKIKHINELVGQLKI